MNIIDLIVLVFILLYFLSGFYRGFVPSLLNLGGYFASWLTAFLAYPLVSGGLVNSQLFSSLKFYIEGAEKIGNYELVRMSVDSISSTQLSSIMETANVPAPFSNAIVANVNSRAFAGQGITTLGDYFNTSIYNVIINIISILLIFLIMRVLLTLITNAFSYSCRTPQLKRFDGLAGGGIGIVRGFFSMYVLFMIVPVILILLPINIITNTIGGSAASTFFYKNSIVLWLIRGSV